MIKSCRDVLRGLQKLTNNTEDILSFLGDTTCICRDDNYSTVYDYSKYQNEIRSIISQLVKDGYLEYSAGKHKFSLTQLVLHPYRFKIEEIKKFSFTSILVPIVVSVATTVITLLVQGLLPMP